MRFIPLMIVPLIIFNLAIAGHLMGRAPFAGDPWAEVLFSVQMMSGGIWSMNFGQGLIVLGLAFLFVEVLKATRTNNTSVIDHMLSTLVLIAFVVEFLLIPAAAHPVFFILGCMALIDVLAGFSVSIRAAGRDISLN